jgi:PmbA protein
MTPDTMRRIVTDAVGSARSGGADTAEAALKESSEFSVIVRNGRIEQLTDSRSSRLVVTVSRDRRMANVTTTDLSPDGIARIITDGIELAGVMDRDEYFGLPRPEELGAAEGYSDIRDADIVQLPVDRRIETAMELERIALDADERIISDGASFATETVSFAFANSQGFDGCYAKPIYAVEISCAVQDEPAGGEQTGKKQSSYWYSAAMSLDGLEPIEEIASRAVSRTLRKIGAVKPATCEVPVVFDPLTGKKFIEWIAKAARGGNIYRKSSFLVGKRGERVAPSGITIVDDPLLPGGLASRPFDAEGVASRRTVVIEDGVLRNYLLDTYEARKLGLRTTGNAGGSSNFYLAPGDTSPEEIIRNVHNGLLLTNLFGPGGNWSTGDFSQGGQGIWIENGTLTYPVNEFTVAGTFPRILEGMAMVGNDLSWRSEFASPTFLVERMTISGT